MTDIHDMEYLNSLKNAAESQRNAEKEAARKKEQEIYDFQLSFRQLIINFFQQYQELGYERPEREIHDHSIQSNRLLAPVLTQKDFTEGIYINDERYEIDMTEYYRAGFSKKECYRVETKISKQAPLGGAPLSHDPDYGPYYRLLEKTDQTFSIDKFVTALNTRLEELAVSEPKVPFWKPMESRKKGDDRPGNEKSSTATLVLILAIAAPFTSLLTGVPALILGLHELSQIKTGRHPSGGSLYAKIGVGVGIFSTSLLVIATVIAFSIYSPS